MIQLKHLKFWKVWNLKHFGVGFKEWRLQNHEIESKLIYSDTNFRGARGGTVVKTLHYKLEGR
jgi:hypothetical protein